MLFTQTLYSVGPYPPMPKYQPDLGTKLVIPEEEINLPDVEEDIPDVWDLNDPDHVKVCPSLFG